MVRPADLAAPPLCFRIDRISSVPSMKNSSAKLAYHSPLWIWYASFADEFFIEGTLDMRSIRKHSGGAARSAGRTMLASFAAVLLAANSGAQSHQSVPDVTTLSMEDLMNMQVTSVSKRTQKVAGAAAAVFVITREDIRRSC